MQEQVPVFSNSVPFFTKPCSNLNSLFETISIGSRSPSQFSFSGMMRAVPNSSSSAAAAAPAEKASEQAENRQMAKMVHDMLPWRISGDALFRGRFSDPDARVVASDNVLRGDQISDAVSATVLKCPMFDKPNMTDRYQYGPSLSWIKSLNTTIGTPLKHSGCLVYFEVGTGKTLASLHAARNFIDFHKANDRDPMVIVATNSSLQNTWAEEWEKYVASYSETEYTSGDLICECDTQFADYYKLKEPRKALVPAPIRIIVNSVSGIRKMYMEYVNLRYRYFTTNGPRNNHPLMVILDEVQLLQNGGADKRRGEESGRLGVKLIDKPNAAQWLEHLRRMADFAILLSATPVTHDVVNFRHITRLLSHDWRFTHLRPFNETGVVRFPPLTTAFLIRPDPIDVNYSADDCVNALKDGEPDGSPRMRMARAIYDYMEDTVETLGEAQLSLIKGGRIEVLDQTRGPDGWWLGRDTADNKQGIFPSAVVVLDNVLLDDPKTRPIAQIIFQSSNPTEFAHLVDEDSNAMGDQKTGWIKTYCYHNRGEIALGGPVKGISYDKPTTSPWTTSHFGSYVATRRQDGFGRIAKSACNTSGTKFITLAKKIREDAIDPLGPRLRQVVYSSLRANGIFGFGKWMIDCMRNVEPVPVDSDKHSRTIEDKTNYYPSGEKQAFQSDWVWTIPEARLKIHFKLFTADPISLRKQAKDWFNQPPDAGVCRVLLLSAFAREGLSLVNGTSFHIMEPQDKVASEIQAVGRIRRRNAQSNLTSMNAEGGEVPWSRGIKVRLYIATYDLNQWSEVERLVYSKHDAATSADWHPRLVWGHEDLPVPSGAECRLTIGQKLWLKGEAVGTGYPVHVVKQTDGCLVTRDAGGKEEDIDVHRFHILIYAPIGLQRYSWGPEGNKAPDVELTDFLSTHCKIPAVTDLEAFRAYTEAQLEDPMEDRTLRLLSQNQLFRDKLLPTVKLVIKKDVEAIAAEVHKKEVERSVKGDFPVLIRKDMTQCDWQLSDTMERYSKLNEVILKPLQLIGQQRMNRWMKNGDFYDSKSIVPYGTSSQHARQFIDDFEYSVRGSYSGVGLDDPTDDESITDEYIADLTDGVAIKFVVYSARKCESGWCLNKISPSPPLWQGEQSAWVDVTMRDKTMAEKLELALFPMAGGTVGARRTRDVAERLSLAPIIIIFHGKEEDWLKQLDEIGRELDEEDAAPAVSTDQNCIVSLM